MDLAIFFSAVLYASAIKSSHAVYKLKPIHTVYVPFRVDLDCSSDPTQCFVYDEGVAEQMAINDDYPYLYTIGNNLIHVLDISKVSAAEVVHSFAAIEDGAGVVNDIAACGELVAANIDNSTSPLEGRLQLYTRYQPGQTPPMRKLHDVAVGALPDAAAFTSDCEKILVAIEGEVREVDGVVVDPEGGVTLVELGPDPENVPPVVTFVNMTQFNPRVDELKDKGIRKSYNGEGTDDINFTTLSQDLEPENIAIDEENYIAYVSLQENNGLASFDIRNRVWTDIRSFGTKNYTGYAKSRFTNKMDPSDRDDGITIRNWPINGILQPDKVKFMTMGKQRFLVTTNEGDDRNFRRGTNGVRFRDGIRGRDLLDEFEGGISAEMPNSTIELLGDDEMLGRLWFSRTDGLDSTGAMRDLHFFGGRSFSIFNLDTWEMEYDSGTDLAWNIALKFPTMFNGGHNGDESPEERFDARSDQSGCEPETVEIGQLGRKTFIFVGLERPGMVAMYSIEYLSWQKKLHLFFEDLYYGGGFNDTYENLYQQRVAHALDVEDLQFIHRSKSPTGRPLLIAAGSVSGTITFFDIISMVK